ncbi:Tht1-like nuclear fusion protein-domain-containing protein [Rhizophagus irregularis DAOM 181602=DAOM 197198]|nr:Tht1-like nuclear fusion protein-domain-containing protein [Rhizophagus irregularis DAOM 181602=DAOM 197198]
MNDYSSECVVALGKVSQFWTTYDGFYCEVVQMCFSIRYSIEIDLLSQFSKNITHTYSNIISDLSVLITSLRDEEKERLPRITNSLNELVNDVETIKTKSALISSEMEMFQETIKKFQNKIKETSIHVTTLNEAIMEDLSISNKNTLNIVIEKLFGIEEIASNTLLEHQKLQNSVGETKKEIDELLIFSKNEIKEFSSYSQNEIRKFTKSIDTITSTFIALFKLVRPS